MSDKQRLVLSIIDFLNKSIQDGTVKQDDQESLEVASKSKSCVTKPCSCCHALQSNASEKRSGWTLRMKTNANVCLWGLLRCSPSSMSSSRLARRWAIKAQAPHLFLLSPPHLHLPLHHLLLPCLHKCLSSYRMREIYWRSSIYTT